MIVKWTELSDRLLILLVVVIGVGFPHLMVAGSLPGTDEGVLAYFSQIIHSSIASGKGLPDTGMLVLYPMLLSWVFELPVNHIIFLRLTDTVVAMVGGWILYRVIETESRSRVGASLITLVFLFTMNQPLFIQAGFKNGIFAAYVPLFLALRLAQGAFIARDKTWLLVGALMALAVLLRETFLPFIIVGAFAVLLAQGWSGFFRYSFGALLGGVTIMFFILSARGGFQQLLESYRDAGGLYASVANERIPLFISNGISSAKEAAVCLSFAGVSIVLLILNALWRRCPKTLGRISFWIVVALVPLIEPFSKIGFPYHFAVCLPGLAGLSALAWRKLVIEKTSNKKMAFATSFALVHLIALLPAVVMLAGYWGSTRNNLMSVNNSAWPMEAVSQSNYLLAADAIRKASPPNGTLSVSGFMFSLYPLTGLLPPSYDMAHLTGLFIKLGSDERRFEQALKACPPDVLMTTTRTELPGSDAIAKIVRETGLYEPVATIPIAPGKSYWNFGGTVYKKIEREQNRCIDVYAQ
jgi:uncharacterized membrane protein